MYGTYYVMCRCIGYGMGYCTGDGGGVWYIFGVLYIDHGYDIGYGVWYICI